MLKLVHDADQHAQGNPTTIDIDELCRLAAKQMLATALLAERQAYLDAHAELVDATGKRLVVANGYAKGRTVTTGAGPVEVKAPRVDDRREGEHYRSAILPATCASLPR
jgi:Arc/MetJ family transcription regulator